MTAAELLGAARSGALLAVHCAARGARLLARRVGRSIEDSTTAGLELASRYPTASGELFQGFIATSADKIFDSTDARRPNVKSD